jgi:competence protein ComGC
MIFVLVIIIVLLLVAIEILGRKNERYKKALSGVMSCSTCEVCRGAAEIALGRRK